MTSYFDTIQRCVVSELRVIKKKTYGSLFRSRPQQFADRSYRRGPKDSRRRHQRAGISSTSTNPTVLSET